MKAAKMFAVHDVYIKLYHSAFCFEPLADAYYDDVSCSDKIAEEVADAVTAKAKEAQKLPDVSLELDFGLVKFSMGANSAEVEVVAGMALRAGYDWGKKDAEVGMDFGVSIG
jgi:hypothetical protein